MGIIAQHLQSLISKQIQDNGVVVWYDPGSHYADAFPGLAFEGTRIVAYEGSFYELRHDADELLNGEEPPRLLVYVPLDPSESHHALAELEAMGVVMRPGQQPPARNTRLALVVRNALRPSQGEEAAEAIEKEVEQGKLSLAEAEEIAERSGVGKAALLSSIFKTASAANIALEFLTTDGHDAALTEKGAIEELASVLGTYLGVDFASAGLPAELRHRLAQHVLATDLAVALGGELPEPLSGVPMASTPATREACQQLANAWRAGRQSSKSYARHAGDIERALQVGKLEIPLADLRRTEAFLVLEERCQNMVEAGLLECAGVDLVDAADERQSSFWSSHVPEVQARWALIATIGRLLLAAQRAEEWLDSPPSTAEAFVESYAGGDGPLCLLDTYDRHMEQRVHQFPFGMSGEHARLEQLITLGRERYASVAGRMSEAFLRQLQEGGFDAGNVLRHWQVFPAVVRRALEEGKTAYLLVDALRFEMCRELLSGLGDEWGFSLQPAIGAVPSVTQVGMAALVTGREESLTVRASADGKLCVEAGGNDVTGRADRVAHLKRVAGAKAHVIRLEDMLPAPEQRVKKAIREADLVVVTSQEIDSVCEQGNPSLAHRMMGDLLQQLRRAMQVLSELAVERIVIAADHGYLFLEELGDDMKIDAPGGQTVMLHRRAWLGKGGASSPSLMRTDLAQLGIDSDLEIAVPWGFGCLKAAGGGTTYFHGGMSLQEMVVPVATVSITSRGPTGSETDIAWSLTLGSERITTRFVSVQISGTAKALFAIENPKLRLELRHDGAVVSQPVSASYGFNQGTGEVQVRPKKDKKWEIEPNTVTLMLTEESGITAVSVHLLDPGTGRELARVPKVEVLLSM